MSETAQPLPGPVLRAALEYAAAARAQATRTSPTMRQMIALRAAQARRAIEAARTPTVSERE